MLQESNHVKSFALALLDIQEYAYYALLNCILLIITVLKLYKRGIPQCCTANANNFRNT